MMLPEFLLHWAGRSTTYLIEGALEVSYARLAEVSRANAEMMADAGVSGDNVALLASNTVDCVAAYWSLLLAGASVLLLDPKMAEEELSALAQRCDCNWAASGESVSSTARALAEKADLGLIRIKEQRAGVVFAPPIRRRREQGSDVAVLCVTSGSTGKSKAAMLTHENLDANTASNIESLMLRSDDVALIALPLSYSYPHTSQFLSHTRLGGTIVLYDKPIFLPKRFCELIEEHSVTVTSLVPTLLHVLNNYRYLHKHDLRSLRHISCGGAPMDMQAAESLMAKLPLTRLIHTYGLTEASPRVATLGPSHDINKLPSIGKPMPGVEVRILSDDGAPAGIGVAGHLQVRGKNLMAGYYGSPEETKEVISDGWLRTGDLARFDDEGYIHLIGRTKNIIISGGSNVSPEEIESILRTHPGIVDVAVRGEYDQGLGEAPVAYVSIDGAQPLSLRQVHEFLRGKLAEWKWPEKLYVGSVIPKTPSGKVKTQSIQ